MTWIDKLELGLKEDAPFRKDNLPESQIRGPEVPSGPGRSPVIPMARHDKNDVPDAEPLAETESEPAEDTSEADATDDGMPPSGKT
jgi:hypothetical protein